MMMKQENPSIDTVLKVAESATEILERRNVPPKLVPSPQERKKIQNAINQAMQRTEQQQAAANHMGKVDPNKAPEQGSAAEQMSKMGV